MSALTICLWSDGRAEEMARFYEASIPGTRVAAVRRAPADYPAGRAGDVLTAEFTMLGTRFVALNGGPGSPFTQAVSLQVETGTQAETDRLWDAPTADGGEEVACGWCRDRFGLSWQVVPRALSEGMAHPDPAAAARVMAAMMTMVRIDVAAIERAAAGD